MNFQHSQGNWQRLAEQQQQFGGGSSKAPKQEKISMPQTPAVKIPEAPKPEPIPPAPTASNLEVQQAQEDARQQAAKRKGIRRTLVAGETGGYTGSDSAKKTLLG